MAKEIVLNAKGQEICGAKKRNGTGICQSIILIGNTHRCWLHGGKSPTGLASASFKTGRHSRYLPARLYDKFVEAQNDPMLFELRGEVALVDVRIGELLQRVDTGESAEIWKRLDTTFQKLKGAIMGDGDAQAVVFALGELEKNITTGIGDWAAWAEIARMVEQRRKLVESERTHQKAMQQLMSYEQAMLFAGAVLASLKANITDKGLLNKISNEIDGHLKR